MFRRLPDGLSAVERGSGPVVCIAGGQSLTQEQCDSVRGRARVIAINNAYLRAPWADVLYFADARWHGWHWNGDKRIACMGLTAAEVSRRFHAFKGQKCCLDVTDKIAEDVHRLRYIREPWSDDPGAVARGDFGHAGLQALQIAANAGGDPIILLGYEARDPRHNEATHWHGEHPERISNRGTFGKWRRSYAMAEPEIKARGLTVINCTPNTGIESFPKMRLEDAFAACTEPAAA